MIKYHYILAGLIAVVAGSAFASSLGGNAGPSPSGERLQAPFPMEVPDEEGYPLALDAAIEYGEPCGHAKAGREAYVKNKLATKSVRATVRTYWRQGIDSGQSDKVYTIPAGSRTYLGCTRSNGIPVSTYTFKVVGCE